MYISLVASTFSSISIFFSPYILYIYIYTYVHIKFIKNILLGKGMVVKIIFQCTSFHNVKVVSNKIHVQIYHIIIKVTFIYLVSFFTYNRFIYNFCFGNFQHRKQQDKCTCFIFLFFIFKDPFCHYTHVYDCTKCKDMNNLHHILHILFFFIRPFTLSHTCTPPYIINLSSVHLLSHEGMIKKRNEIMYTDAMKK